VDYRLQRVALPASAEGHVIGTVSTQDQDPARLDVASEVEKQPE
jgi:hypothetical protein